MTSDPGREDGQVVAMELLAWLPTLLVAALFGWQLLLVATTTTAAEHAALVGSRMVAAGGDGRAAALESLPPRLREGAKLSVDGTRVALRVDVPAILPGLDAAPLRVERSAELPWAASALAEGTP